MINAFQNVITLTRGDDCVLVVDITDISGNAYIPAGNDVVKFYVKKPSSGALEEQAALITKTFNADQTCSISKDDTANLDLGTYKYGVVLTKADGTVATIIPPTDFIIEEGITK